MYFPKSQIQTNLYSNGELTVKSTKEIYTGYYWSTSNGTCYAGKVPSSDGPLIELQKGQDLSLAAPQFEPDEQQSLSYIEGTLNNLQYAALQGIDFDKSSRVPNYIPPRPTNEDYTVGFVTRYFCKKKNESLFIEIGTDDFVKLKNKDKDLLHEYYTPFNLNWILSGDKNIVFNENRIAVETLEFERGYDGLGRYLNYNYTQLHGLYTNGGEYLLPNGKNYIGLYHIHPSKGAMVGIAHTPNQHDILTPINGIIPSSQTPSPSSQPTSQPSNIYNGSNTGRSGY